MTSPLICRIVLVFNGERYPQEALNSIPQADLPASGTCRRR
jgi:hypothetical protein